MSTSQLSERRAHRQRWDSTTWKQLRIQGCETCDGEEHITVMASDGAWIDIPCPCCAPNDAPGG